jgi:hypothetical protein
MPVKNNYRAWQIRLEDFPKDKNLESQIRFLLGFAVLAPSGHNSQPWDFKIKSDTLEILINRQRFLTKNDAEGRQSFIGIGCLIENLLLAADYYGLNTKAKYFPEPDNSEVVASILFTKAMSPDNKSGHLMDFITKRVSNRNKYNSKKPELKFLSNLPGIEYTSFRISSLEGENKNSLAETMVKAQIKVMENKEFRDELSNYIKSNRTDSEYGMPGFTLGMPLPISFFASKLIKRFNMSKLSEKKDKDLLIEHTPIILIISSEKDEKHDWVKTGTVLENLWLNLTKNSLCCSILAAAIQLPNFREEVKKLTGLNLYPQVIIRCGYSNIKGEHSPRFNLKSLILN